MRLLADANIPHITHYFSEHFELDFYHHYSELKKKISWADILICSSYNPISKDLVKDTHLEVVATASSGSNHIDMPALEQANIHFFDAKGANCQSVCDYMMACIAYLEQQAYLDNPSIAIIGYGYVGHAVKKRLDLLNYQTMVYDPFIQPYQNSNLIEQADLICLHPNYHLDEPYPSHHLICSRLLSKLKSDVCIINAARGEVVDERAILDPKFKGIYCTDVYQNEPNINPDIVARASLATPHIAGHAYEAKEHITAVLAEKIHQYYKFIASNTQTASRSTNIVSCQNWQKQVLKYYHPLLETQALKACPNRDNFLALRQAHLRNQRHSFIWVP